jgi:hypothetical protein
MVTQIQQQHRSLSQRFSEWFRGVPEKAKQDYLKHEIEEQRRTQIYPYQLEHSIIEPEWNYDLLVAFSRNNEVLRTAHEAIIKEATRNGGSVEPRWMAKCPSCGTEFQTEVPSCPDCTHIGNNKSVAMIQPDIVQKKRLEAFIDDPNSTDEILDIQISSMRFMLSCSDWYLSMQGKLTAKQKAERFNNPYLTMSDLPFTIHVEDAAKIKVCADKYGNLGNNEYFCPNCNASHPELIYSSPQPCGICGAATTETAYIHMGEGTQHARFSKDELLHGKLDPNLPSLYGLSREISCLRILMCIDVMDQFNFDNYSDGKLAMMLGFEKLPQDEVNKLMEAIKVQRNKPEYDNNLKRFIVRKLRVLGIGGGGGAITAISTMPESEKMQNLDWWKLWRETVNAVYGLADVVAGAQKEGTTGQNPRMKIDVSNNTTELIQKAWADPFNNVVVQALGVTDWIYKFKPLEEKDEAQDMAILQSKLLAMQTAISLGFDVEFTDEQEVKISGKPLSLQEKQQQAMDTMQKQADIAGKNKIGEESASNGANPAFDGKQAFKKENVFANEKGYIVIPYNGQKKEEQKHESNEAS